MNCKNKIILNYILIPFFIIQLNGCVSYLYHLGKEQIKIMSLRKKIEKVLKVPNINQNTKKKLELVSKVRKFAVDKLYLNPEGGYLYYVELDREELGWHVTASYPLKFQSYTWWFPFVGNVPYKGYFRLDMTQEEEKKLIQEGYDTRIRITAGYSTLGWFSDPIFSTQLRAKEDNLVALVIHEMAHATVYFNGDALFNESYATFVEEIGTELYYKSISDPKADEIIQKRKILNKEHKIILGKLKQTAYKLQKLYESSVSDDIKKLEKERIMEEFKGDIISSKEFKQYNTEKFKTKKLNNEDFIGILRYNSGTEFFKNKFIEFGEDFKKFHKEMAKLKELSKEERQKLLVK